jgi:hypothetical protein
MTSPTTAEPEVSVDISGWLDQKPVGWIADRLVYGFSGADTAEVAEHAGLPDADRRLPAGPQGNPPRTSSAFLDPIAARYPHAAMVAAVRFTNGAWKVATSAGPDPHELGERLGITDLEERIARLPGRALHAASVFVEEAARERMAKSMRERAEKTLTLLEGQYLTGEPDSLPAGPHSPLPVSIHFWDEYYDGHGFDLDASDWLDQLAPDELADLFGGTVHSDFTDRVADLLRFYGLPTSGPIRGIDPGGVAWRATASLMRDELDPLTAGWPLARSIAVLRAATTATAGRGRHRDDNYPAGTGSVANRVAHLVRRLHKLPGYALHGLTCELSLRTPWNQLGPSLPPKKVLALLTPAVAELEEFHPRMPPV